jgi:small-conductance mechanosensitive channel
MSPTTVLPAAVPNPLDWPFYHNTLRDWLLALGLATGVFLGLVLVRRLLSRHMETVAKRTSRDIDDIVARTIHHTRLFFLAAVALDIGSDWLTLPPHVETAVRNITTVLIFLQIALWINDLVGFVLHRYSARRAMYGDVQSPTTLAALGIAARIVLWLIIVLIALDNLGVHVTTLVAGLGISGVAVALAVQNVLGDVFAALSIITDKPFVVGDAITVDNFTGTVESIGIKSTRVRSTTGEQIIFANTDLLKSRIRNWKRMHERGVYLTTKVGYETPRAVIERVPEMIREIVSAQRDVRFVRSHIKALGDAAIEVETLYFIQSPSYDVYMDVQGQIAVALLNRFGDEGVVIATPLHTVVLRPDKHWNAATNSDAEPATPTPAAG